MDKTLTETEIRWVRFVERNTEYKEDLWNAWQKIIDGEPFEDTKAHFISNVTDDPGIAGAISFFGRKMLGKPMASVQTLRHLAYQYKEERRLARIEADQAAKKRPFVVPEYGAGTYTDKDGNQVHWVGRHEKFN